MGKMDFYIEKLKTPKNWDAYLLAESGLPGPRGNLELAHAFAEIGDEKLVKKYMAMKPEEAPKSTCKETQCL